MQIAAPAQVGSWHGPEAPSGALYDCYRMSSGLEPDRAFGPELTRTRPRLDCNPALQRGPWPILANPLSCPWL